MNESPQQYTSRITSYVQGENHLNILRLTPRKIARVLKGKKPASLTKRPSAEKWSVGEILAHLAEGEIVFAYRLRLVASVNGTPIQAYDQDVWQANAGYLKKNPTLGLATFTALRELNVAFLKSLSAEQRNQYGMHAERGQESVVRMMELYAGHDVNHMRQIEEMVGGNRSKKQGGGTRSKRNGR